jgi:C4-dicarboxylate-specific signal transduction histidine kinase
MAGRRYNDTHIKALKLAVKAVISDNSHIIQITSAKTDDEYLSSYHDMRRAGWSVWLLTPLGDLREQSLTRAFTMLLLALSLLLIGLLAWQRRRRHKEQELFHRDAQKQLEKKGLVKNRRSTKRD